MTSLFRRSMALVCALTAALGGGAARAQSGDFIFSPYQHLALTVTADTPALSLAKLPREVKALSWAFAVGECAKETWNGLDAALVAHANVDAFVRAGIGYIISTGGEGGVFTCGSDAGMEAFVARYASPQLLGIDFDIEAGQTPEMIDALVRRAAALHANHPTRRLSYTLPTWAASDASGRSLNPHGERVLRALREHGLHDAYINLMVMTYGEPRPQNCVVKDGACDMARSAMQAAINLHRGHGVPMQRIELTPMIGLNDLPTSVFTLDDAQALSGWAREQGLAGLHYWSLDRDASCMKATTQALPDCSGVEGLPRGAFARALSQR